MTTVAILPVKRFANAKQRLAASLPADLRRSLAEAMVADVLRALRRTSAIDEIVVVTAEPIAAALATSQGAKVVPDPEERGHSEAALLGIAAVPDAARVLLVPGDCPALAPADIDDVLRCAPPAPSVVVVPDRVGSGTNALLLTPPGVMAPSFGPDSRARHEGAAAGAGVAHVVADVQGFALDVDTPEDLAAVRDALQTARGTAASTRGLLGRITATGT